MGSDQRGVVKVKVSERRRPNDQSGVWAIVREGKDDEGEVYEHAHLGAHEALYLAGARRQRFCHSSVHSSFNYGGRHSS